MSNILSSQTNVSQYLTQETNSLDTGNEGSVWKWGNRMEFGYMEGHQGIQFTTLSMESQTTDFTRLRRRRHLQRLPMGQLEPLI